MKRIFRKKIRGVSGEGRKVWLFPTYYFFQCFLTYVYTFSFLLPTVFSNLSLLARLAAGCCISFLCFLIPKPYPHFFLRMETYIYIYAGGMTFYLCSAAALKQAKFLYSFSIGITDSSLP